jgi:hypothetical protein
MAESRPPEPPSLDPGLVLGGRYHLREPVSCEPGLAIWRAQRGDTRVLLCTLPAGFLAGPAEHRLFIEAGRAATAVPSNHVVPVLDAGVDRELAVPYVSAEDASGRTLEQIVAAEGALEPAQAAALLGDAARGVLDAQRAGVAHGDLGPHRILVGPRAGQTVVRLTGYGLAPALRRRLRGEPAGPAPRSRLTGGARRYGADVRGDLLELGHALVFALAGPETATALRLELLEGGDEKLKELLAAMPGAGSWPETLHILLGHLLRSDPEQRPFRTDAVATVLSAAASGRDVRAEQVLLAARVRPEIDLVEEEDPAGAAAWASAAEERALRRRRVRRWLVVLAGLALAGALFFGVSFRMGNVLRPEDLPLFGILRPIPPPTEVSGIALEEVLRVFKSERPSLSHCRKLHFTGQPPPIPLRVSLDIGPRGQITRLEVDGAPPAHQAIADCVREAISGWTFGDPFEGIASVQHRVWMDQL